MKNKLILLLLTLVLIFSGCSYIVQLDDMPISLIPDSNEASTQKDDVESNQATAEVSEDGIYSTPEDVALYIHTFDKLPSNFVTKNEARDLGWDNSKGNLWDVTDNMSIGGDKFGNREGLLPKADGRIYYECDVNYNGGFRGAQRIVFSNDGLIFYTDDHYESFEQLY